MVVTTSVSGSSSTPKRRRYRLAMARRSFGNAPGRRVPVVAGVAGGLGQLLDSDIGARDVGVAEAHVDDVPTGVSGLVAQLVDDGEDVRRQPIDPAELHPARLAPANKAVSSEPGLATPPGAWRQATAASAPAPPGPLRAALQGAGEQPGPDGSGRLPQDGRFDAQPGPGRRSFDEVGEGSPGGRERTSPAVISPPPSTMSSGSRALARLARPNATHQPNSFMISRPARPPRRPRR